MEVLGVEINKMGKYSELRKRLLKSQSDLKTYKLMRPGAEETPYASDSQGIKVPYRYDSVNNYRGHDELYKSSDIWRTIISAVTRKMFHRGIEILPKVENPSEEQKDVILQLLHKSNDNNQTLRDVLNMFDRYLNIHDDSYSIIAKDYTFNQQGEIIHGEPQEIISSHPEYMRIISDAEGRRGYNDKGERVFVNPAERTKMITQSEAESMNFVAPTGHKLVPAIYRGEMGQDYGTTASQMDGQERYVYYIEGEVLHLSKFHPSLLYGYSPGYSIWMKLTTLIGQDRYFLLNYMRNRPPRAMLTISTSNYASAKRAWEHLKAETKKDPHIIAPLLIENEKGKQSVTFTDFLKSPEEMKLMEFRNEARRQIGAIYGVMPIFGADIQQSGGLNNESFQGEVTNVSIKDAQKLYNEKFFPWLLTNWNITDWILKLREPEEDDEMEDTKMTGVKIDNATKMSDMGFEVTWDENLDEFKFSDKPVREPTTAGSSQESGAGEGGFFDSSRKVQKMLIASDVKKMNDLREGIKKAILGDREDLTKDGLKFDIKKADDETLIDELSKQLFDKSYSGLNKQISNRINKILLDGAVDKTSLDTIVKRIGNLGVDKSQAETIARTERSVLQNNIREFNFDKAEGSEKFVYKWIGPSDKRTSDISKEIKEKSSKGLPIEKLKTLVKKTSEKFGFKPDRDWFSHPNQRHTFVRKV